MAFVGGIPFPVQFFLAFVVVLGLIGATAWAVRRFASGRLTGVGIRGRQPRLAVIDYASVDARRRLILVRRDNVEHLVMIGGPTDIVVESNIVRATPAARDVVLARPAATEPARAIPLPDANGDEMWTPAESAAQRRAEVAPEEPVAFPLQPHAEAASRAPRDTLAALADELSTRPSTPGRSRPQQSSRPQPLEPHQESMQDSKEESRPEFRPEPQQEGRTGAQPAATEPASATEQSFAEMAHRLEAALRKPSAKIDRPETREPRGALMPRPVTPAEHAPETAPPAPTSSPPAPPPSPLARALRTAELRAARTDAPKQPNSGKALYDSLEQEMASLLGRSTAKN